MAIVFFPCVNWPSLPIRGAGVESTFASLAVFELFSPFFFVSAAAASCPGSFVSLVSGSRGAFALPSIAASAATRSASFASFQSNSSSVGSCLRTAVKDSCAASKVMGKGEANAVAGASGVAGVSGTVAEFAPLVGAIDSVVGAAGCSVWTGTSAPMGAIDSIRDSMIGAADGFLTVASSMSWAVSGFPAGASFSALQNCGS